MFLGEPLSIQRYDKFRYPKFFELWQNQRAFNWNPEEIDLTKDRVDYEELTDTERFVFNSNLRWQTMTDSMLSRSIHKITEYVSNNELEICMGKWADFENLHSFSYTWILQNITRKPGEFFDSILKDQEIVRRAKEISAAYDSLLGNSDNIKQKIFDSVLSTQITEGVSFYISFACSLFFGYKGKMVGNADIVRLIMRDENLHVAITNHILKNWRDEPSEGFQQVFRDNQQKVYDAYGLAVENEKSWADYLFSNGSLLGLNAEVLKGHIEWVANNRLASNGFSKIYDRKTSPIAGWLDSYVDSKKIQVAPQESEITTYRIGARDTTFNTSDFEDIEL